LKTVPCYREKLSLLLRGSISAEAPVTACKTSGFRSGELARKGMPEFFPVFFPVNIEGRETASSTVGGMHEKL
jgi:hypothetical protein